MHMHLLSSNKRIANRTERAVTSEMRPPHAPGACAPPRKEIVRVWEWCEMLAPPVPRSDGSLVMDLITEQLRGHSIYRVPEYIKSRTKRHAYAYRPQLVSLGPFHHGQSLLLPMEPHKSRAVEQLVKRSGKPPQEFIVAVEISDQLCDAYENLHETWRQDRQRFVKLMVTDGCFFLEVMRMFQLKGKVEKDYGSDDPFFSKHGYLYLRDEIISDMLLIENQLPFLLLQKLMYVACYPNTFQMLDDCWTKHEEQTNKQMQTFLHNILTPASPINGHLGCHLHPLDILHKSVCGKHRHYQKSTLEHAMYYASELHETGIHFKVSDVCGFTSVSFKRGVLSIPQISFFDNTERMLLNLLAFEQLHPGVGDDVNAFVYFMAILINTHKDVALPRSKGIIENNLGSDGQVAYLINEILSRGAVLSPDNNINNVLDDMTTHCKKPWNKWRATFVHTYFINPWMFSSLIAAFILLFATVVQTIYTAMSFYENKS
ncbi:hypothetical protein GUJ93_ZPchr0011g28076 [Zizania palustris]|uniref:Uncharacterized protein n=1 Tax=Zizania palustris TaxID=103762 RepID=A0A8J5WK31_ZIZPA|nr:hypothetical protein GUJ93_ZPchr0011g28076 [Zizania palustris]